jgi:hypothetical protein
MLFVRLAVMFSLATCVAASALTEEAAAQGYVPGYQPYPQQPAPLPPQPQPQYQPQPQPQYQPQPQPQAGYYPPAPGQPGYGQYPAPGYPQPGYPYGAPAPEPMVSSVAGLIQLSLGTSFLQYMSHTYAYDGGVSEDVSTTNWGFANNPILLEGGYGLTPNIIIGGQLKLGGQSDSDGVEGGTTAKRSTFDFWLGPKIDYQFMPTSKFNPFAGAVIAVALDSQNFEGASKTSLTTFNFLARGGFRYFVLEQLSIDPVFTIGYGFGSGSRENSPSPSAATTSAGLATKTTFSQHALQVGLGVSVSLWLH